MPTTFESQTVFVALLPRSFDLKSRLRVVTWHQLGQHLLGQTLSELVVATKMANKS
jgi:hypothetical protein